MQDDSDIQRKTKKGLAVAGKAAKKTGTFLLKKIAVMIGIPVGAFLGIFLMGLIIFLSIYGALPVEVNADGVNAQYEAVIKKYSPEIISDDRTEEQYMLTWGILAAIDYKKHLIQSESPDDKVPFTASKTAQKLAPKFKYTDSVKVIVKTIIDEEGNAHKERTEIPVKLVSEVNTYRGIYRLHYERTTISEGSTTITKDILFATEHTDDWSRLIEVMEDEGIPADQDAAYLMHRTGEGFESGAPYFTWLTESEEEIWISGAAGWDWTPGSYYIPEEYLPYFTEAANKTGVDIELIKAVAAVESCFNPNAVSPSGAIGIMQLMPSTAKQTGVKNAFDPKENILGGAKYLKQLLDKFKKPELALAAYNAGPGNVEKYGGVPPFEETQSYVSKVTALWKTGIPTSDSIFMAPVKGSITSPFGERIHPIKGTKSFHSGIDIGAPLGTAIRAPKDGTVKFVGTSGWYGLTVILDHGNGVTTVYGHCLSFNVDKNQEVKRGQIIAKVGSTGVSTGPHLHYEIRINGNAVDPAQYL